VTASNHEQDAPSRTQVVGQDAASADEDRPVFMRHTAGSGVRSGHAFTTRDSTAERFPTASNIRSPTFQAGAYDHETVTAGRLKRLGPVQELPQDEPYFPRSGYDPTRLSCGRGGRATCWRRNGLR
jgi:hypothetical protein